MLESYKLLNPLHHPTLTCNESAKGTLNFHSPNSITSSEMHKHPTPQNSAKPLIQSSYMQENQIQNHFCVQAVANHYKYHHKPQNEIIKQLSKHFQFPFLLYFRILGALGVLSQAWQTVRGFS
jgi:hypothetical protein